jgi:hypothetical protein
MSRTRLIAFAAAAVLVVAAVMLMFVPGFSGPQLPPLPDGPQALERHELAPTLRRRVQQALEAEGQTTSGQTLVTVGPTDCPQDCNAGMERGLCYCTRDDAGVCPSGWPLERGDSASLCASLPERVRVRPEGAGSPEQTLTF